MPQTTFALLTNKGRSKEAAALANGTVLNITQIALGDGSTVPSGGETKLYNELLRKKITGHGLVVGTTDTAYFDTYLSAAEGPYTIREAGLIDVEGDLIAIAYYDPPFHKPTPESGQSVEGTIRFEVAFSNVENVVVKVDATMQVPLQRLTLCPWIAVKSVTQKSPPENPLIGDAYVIPNDATGLWLSQGQKIAEFTSSGWAITQSRDGHGVGTPDGSVYVRVNGAYIPFDYRNYRVPLAQLNCLPWIPVVSMTTKTAPSVPSKGDMYLVADNPTGEWAGKAGLIAEWNGSKWLFTNAKDGHGIGLPDGSIYVKINGSYQLLRLLYQNWFDLRYSRLAAPPTDTYYVLPSGNDDNTGFAATAAEGFKTIGGAVKALIDRYMTSKTIKLIVSAGTYDGFSIPPSFIGGWRISGNVSAPNTVIIDSTKST